MNGEACDAVALRAADEVSRRSSVIALGTAALAATFAGPTAARAGKAGKKAKKKCKKQGPPCEEFAQDLCATFLPSGTEREPCIDAASACCPSLTRRQGGPFFDCALQVVIDLTVV